MNIIITEEAKDLILGSGRRVITIYSEALSSCWGPASEIFARLRKPEVSQDYNLFKVDGIDVYLYKEAKTMKDEIIIQPARFTSDLANKDFEILGLRK